MADRLTQLLGVVGLAAADRMDAAPPDLAALVHLAAWPGTSVAALGVVVGRSQPATVRLVDRLVERGLVKRGPGPDRRTVALSATTAGAREAEAFIARRGDGLASLLSGITDEERAVLEPLLDRIVAGLADDRPGAVRACRACDRDACQTGPGCPLNHTAPATAADAKAKADPSRGG